MREIRNKFAHHMEPMTFSHPDIIDIIKRRTNSAAPPMQFPQETFMGLFRTLGGLLYLMDK
jgi:hypothetical protein